MLIAMSDAAMATEATTGPAVWVVPDGVKINPATAQPYNHAVRHQDYRRSNPVWQDGQVRLYAARGETVAFQIVIRAADRPIRQVDISTEPLRAADGKQIGNDRYAAFREWFITVKTPATSSYGPGDYPEPLIPARAPRHGLPLTVPPHRCEVLWIDLAVPRDAAAATYRGLVRLTASGKCLAKLPVELTVWDIVLPLAPSQVFDTPIYMGQIARQADPARRGAGPVSTWSPRM
ncbi:MAG: hypothetical protein ACE5K7_05510, partial [Phycisphaerae bacterium]